MWKLIFSSATNRGTGFNREPLEGEFSVDRDKTLCGFFSVNPNRYQYVNGALSEYPGWEAEQAAEQTAAAIEGQKKAISSERYRIETSGVDYNGMTILTDRESQQILDSAIEKIRRGLVPALNWKCANGWMIIDESNIAEIEILVLSHVQSAFAWEKAEIEKLEV